MQVVPTQKVHFIGIKGVGMTSLALAMQDLGYNVSGSDTEEVFVTDAILKEREIPLSLISDSLPPNLDLIIYSGAYSPPKTKIRTLTLGMAISEFVSDRQVIAVAGVGGKTTTSAMLAALFHSAGRDVGYYVGAGSIAGLRAPGHAGTDKFFVMEADEYAISKTDHRPKFALIRPQILITTNIIHDHPDIYPAIEDTLLAFDTLIKNISQGVWFACEDDPLTRKLMSDNHNKDLKIVPYGLNHPLYGEISLSIFGQQNKLDGLAAVLAAIELGLTKDQALSHVKAYRGVSRRQEFYGEHAGRLLYDDYGHHPQEIETTLNSFKENFPGSRIVLVFESHTYSRTERLLPEFAHAISLADKPFLMPIFESAREKGQAHTITPALFEKEVRALNDKVESLTWANAAEKIAEYSRPGDIVLTMGAGFVYKLLDLIIGLL